MLILEKQIDIFCNPINGAEPFKKWLMHLEKIDKAIVINRMKRVRQGNYGDYKSVGDGVLELRFNHGFRIYFTEVDNVIILLLCGGDKSTQQKDIKKAKEYNKILKEKGIKNCIRN